VDDDTSWTLAESGINETPYIIPLSGVDGSRFQLKVVVRPILSDMKTEINCIAVRARELRNLDSNLKREYTLMLELGDQQTSSRLVAQPSALMQITALEELLGTGSTAFIDPLGIHRTVTVEAVETSEILQADESNPIVVAQVTLMEV